MTDIVERLRGYNPPDRTIGEASAISYDIAEAADEIERLQGLLDDLFDEIERLRAWGKEYVVRVAELERLLADKDRQANPVGPDLRSSPRPDTAAAEVGCGCIYPQDCAEKIAAERERCAKVADRHGKWGEEIAAAIRALAK